MSTREQRNASFYCTCTLCLVSAGGDERERVREGERTVLDSGYYEYLVELVRIASLSAAYEIMIRYTEINIDKGNKQPKAPTTTGGAAGSYGNA